MFTMDEPDWGLFALKISPDDVNQTIAYVERSVKPFTSYPFSYEFLEDSFNQMYKEDVRVGKTFGFFTALSLLIAALGLFGLAAFVSVQRTREIGIRKVLGASVQSIVYLISSDFLKLVLISCLIATPLAWYAVDRWLQSFAYRVDPEWWTFATAWLFAIAAAKLAIGYQSVKASLVDPVRSLKSTG
jgi:putative ABC transport system permease protein